MSTVLVTGSCGLICFEAVSFFCEKGFDVIGIDNNMRKTFFGKDGSIIWNKKRLKKIALGDNFLSTPLTEKRFSVVSRHIYTFLYHEKKYRNFTNYSIDILRDIYN